MGERPRGGKGSKLDFAETIEVGAQDGAVEHEIGEFAFALNVDQTRHRKLFEVMGHCSSGDANLVVQRAARRCLRARADLRQDLQTPRLGERTGDKLKLTLGKLYGLDLLHTGRN